MTRSEPPIQRWSLRSLPPLTWAMVLLAVIFVSTSLNSRSVSLLGMLSGLAPFLFAATATYMKPRDARFMYGAVLIGVGRGLSVLAILIASQGVIRGDLADALFDVVGLLGRPIEVVGILVIAMAAGGVRTRIGFGFVAVGAAVAVARALAYVAILPSLPENTSLVFGFGGIVGLLFPIAWALVAGAAFESRRRLMLLAALVLLVVEGVLILFAVLAGNPAANLQVVTLLIDILLLVGWLLLALAPLRLEMGTQRPLREEAGTGR